MMEQFLVNAIKNSIEGFVSGCVSASDIPMLKKWAQRIIFLETKLKDPKLSDDYRRDTAADVGIIKNQLEAYALSKVAEAHTDLMKTVRDGFISTLLTLIGGPEFAMVAGVMKTLV